MVAFVRRSEGLQPDDARHSNRPGFQWTVGEVLTDFPGHSLLWVLPAALLAQVVVPGPAAGASHRVIEDQDLLKMHLQSISEASSKRLITLLGHYGKEMYPDEYSVVRARVLLWSTQVAKNDLRKPVSPEASPMDRAGVFRDALQYANPELFELIKPELTHLCGVKAAEGFSISHDEMHDLILWIVTHLITCAAMQPDGSVLPLPRWWDANEYARETDK